MFFLSIASLFALGLGFSVCVFVYLLLVVLSLVVNKHCNDCSQFSGRNSVSEMTYYASSRTLTTARLEATNRKT